MKFWKLFSKTYIAQFHVFKKIALLTEFGIKAIPKDPNNTLSEVVTRKPELMDPKYYFSHVFKEADGTLLEPHSSCGTGQF